jgi:hypothetical protein
VRPIRLSELEKIRADIEKMAARNFDYVSRHGPIPTALQFGETFLRGPLDQWQREYLAAAPVESRIAIAASRQSGKSTATKIFIAWCLVFVPGFTVLVASRSLRQAAYYLDMIRHQVLTIIPRDAMVQLNRLSMELPNGSQVISIPCAQPDAGRGFSPHLVLLDEAAFAPEGLFTAIFPSVAATQGAIHMISSPNGRQGRFFEAFEGDAKSIYWTRRITWKECPRMTEAQMDMERIALGEMMFRQEFLSEFIQPLGAFFGTSGVLQFEDTEDQDLTGLELADMEEILKSKVLSVEPTVDEMRAAMDAADRVSRLLAG